MGPLGPKVEGLGRREGRPTHPCLGRGRRAERLRQQQGGLGGSGGWGRTRREGPGGRAAAGTGVGGEGAWSRGVWSCWLLSKGCLTLVVSVPGAGDEPFPSRGTLTKRAMDLGLGCFLLLP